jgi:oligopeptidase B
MKDDNWQQVMRDPAALRPDIREHLEAENAYTKAMLAATEPLQQAMFEEMRGRIKEDDSSVPDPRRPLGLLRPLRDRRPAPRLRPPSPRRRDEQALLDVEALAKGKAYFQVGAAEHSPDHALLAYAADEQGSEVHRIYVRDLSTGETLPDPVESSTGDFAWSPDGQWLFWTYRDENARPVEDLPPAGPGRPRR